MTRIVAGLAGGRTLAVPEKGTRPTSERVREALFSRLEHLDVVDGARVLDLYAGSGALGLEAASRGARRVVLVESARAAGEVCRRNVATVGIPVVEVVLERAERFVARPAADGWDLVLVDPPYELSDADLAIVLAGAAPALAAGGVVVVERSSRGTEPLWPAGLESFDRRVYGDTAVWFAERAGSTEPGSPTTAPDSSVDPG